MRDRLIIDVEFVPADGGEPAGYLATCEPVGLVVEADDLDALVARVKTVLPDLMAEQASSRPVIGMTVGASPIFELRHVLTDGDGLLQDAG